MFAQAGLLSELFSQMSVGPLDLFVLVNVQTVFDDISLKREIIYFSKICFNSPKLWYTKVFNCGEVLYKKHTSWER